MKRSTALRKVVALWGYLGRKRRLQLFFMFILMILSVFAEVVSVGAVMPFLSVLTEPEILMEQNWLQPIINFFEIHTANELLLPITIGFIVAVCFSALIRILLLWSNSYLTAKMGIQLRSEIYSRVLYRPYEYHIAQNSSQLISIVTEKVGTTINTGITHVLMCLTALATSLAIIVTLLLINTVVALTTFFILGGGYFFIGYIVRKHIRNNGDIIAKNQPCAVQCMQEGVGGIRDIILDHSQGVFIRSYSKIASNIQLAAMRNSFLSNLPKSILEMMGIMLIAIMALYLQREGAQSTLPMLGALAMGAQRLLPALQQIYYSATTINGNQAILADVLNYLEQPVPLSLKKNESISSPLQFRDHLLLKNVSFQYKGSDALVLKNINLKICKGSRIGIIGSTGSGKTTLLDVIMGLLSPSQGQLVVDGEKIDELNIKKWQANIAHVPQSIFLSDASIADNIAFGIPENHINHVKVRHAAQQAHIEKFINELTDGYQTTVGERGVQLSGGQRQRIGVARALYKQANIIIFDEATSALDDATEMNVMKAIDSLDKKLTVMIIAHRLSTLKECDQIYRLNKGSIVEAGTYEEIVKENNNIYKAKYE